MGRADTRRASRGRLQSLLATDLLSLFPRESLPCLLLPTRLSFFFVADLLEERLVDGRALPSPF